MCAIAGASTDQETLEMLECMRHRAPDQIGVHNTIGMGRLAIIDTGRDDLCPFVEDEFVVTFNGEIFNYIEIRETLIQKGHKFRTDGDIEVLFRAYLEWGTAMLDKLNGMFAFCIFDGERYFLARDHAGEKPLYYREKPFAFASEAKALQWKCKLLPPGYKMLYHNGNLRVEPWWRLESFKRWNIKLDRAEETLEYLLEDAVRLRMRSDVPIGLYYSGGIDSSLISTFGAFKHKFKYKDADHTVEFRENIERIVWHLDYPVESFSAFGLWKLAEQAKKKRVKVVLSGEGADELFGGYVRYLPHSLGREALERYPSYEKYFPEHEDVNTLGMREFYGNLQELLRMGDRMAAAHGIENRCPFLDPRIIRFAFSLPHEYKIKGLDTKLILRRILKRRMPKYVFSEKHGLYCSVNKWLFLDERFDKSRYTELQKGIWQNFQSSLPPTKETI